MGLSLIEIFPIHCPLEFRAGPTIGGKTFDALIFGYYEGDKLIYAARTRNGFTPATREKLMQKFVGSRQTDAPSTTYPKRRAVAGAPD
jgi:ATP-dependent DNA ligase